MTPLEAVRQERKLVDRRTLGRDGLGGVCNWMRAREAAKWLNPAYTVNSAFKAPVNWAIHRYLRDKGFWAVIAVALVYGVYMPLVRDLLLVPAGAVLGLLAVHMTLGTSAEWVVLVIVLMFACWAAQTGRYYLEWLPWISGESNKRGHPVVNAFRALLLLTTGFTALTAVLAEHQWLETTAKETSGLVWATLSYYMWHLLDAVPALKVPATLNWKLAIDFSDHGSGALLLLFKLLVIVPVISAIVGVIQKRKEARRLGERAARPKAT